MATEEAEEGAEILYEGKEPVRADVIFVHGLTGHGSQTWQKGGVLWPRDLLPKALPNVRVIAWNYDVDVLRFFNKTKQNSILQHAENLLFDLGGEREEEGRPIIFVGHSLGGLVVKQALVTASQAEYSKDDNTAGYVDIIKSTIGIIFLGTPHKGSDQTKWDHIATKLAHMIKEGHNDTIIASLSSGSIILEGLQSSFTAVSDRFAYSTLLEEREYPEIGKIVDDESASLYLPRETRNSIPANHADIARFSRPNEIGFKRVINGLKNLLRATARMSSRHDSTSAPPAMSDMSSIPYTERGFSPYDYGRYTPGRGIPFNDPSLYNRDPRFTGYGRDRMSPYDDPAYDERGLPIMLNRVSISQAALGGNPPITAPTAYHSKEDEVAPDETPAMPAPEKAPCVEEQPAAANGNEEQGKEESSHEKPETPAASGEGQAAGGEEAEEVERGEEGGKEEEEEEEEEEHFPSPVTRDMFVRLSQELQDKNKAADETFKAGLNKILWYKKKMVNMLLVKKAEAEINSSGTIPEEIADEIRRSVYGYTHLSASCNECKKRPDDLFHHCILCEGGDYDLCQKCIDNGKKCPGEHPLIEVHKDKDATAPVTPEDEPIFPISDPSPEFVEDDHESTLRALFLACMLGHEDVVSEIVQWGTDSALDVNVPPNAGTSRVKLTPLGVAIVMQYDEIVSSLLNSEPSMVVFEDTIITIEPNEEDSDPPELKEEEDCLDHVMLNGNKTLQEDATENEENEDNESNDDGNDDDSEDEDDEDNGVEEKVAMEAIQLAADYGSAQATKMLLLQWGQDPLPDGYEALHVPVLPDTIETLLNWGANIEEPDHKKQRTPLVWCAALNGSLDKMDTLLRRRANPNARDWYLKTALHYAAIYNRADMVQRLLDNKAVIEVEDHLGNSPLHYVVEQPQHYAIAKLLVSKGASLKHKNKAGQDPMDIAVESKADNGETYLMLAGGKVSRWWNKKFIKS